MDGRTNNMEESEPSLQGNRIYIGHLSPKANEKALMEIFCRYGVITSIWIARKPPGFAFIEYESARDVQILLEHLQNGEIEIHGTKAVVALAGTKANKTTPIPRASNEQASKSTKLTRAKEVIAAVAGQKKASTQRLRKGYPKQEMVAISDQKPKDYPTKRQRLGRELDNREILDTKSV